MMNSAVKFIYSLQEKGVFLSLIDGDIQYTMKESVENLDHQENIKKQILSFKKEIIAILKPNHTTDSGASIYSIELGLYPLTYMQEGLKFIDIFSGGTSAYNVALRYKLLDIKASTEAIEYAIKSVVLRHNILRSFIIEDSENKWYQQIQDLSKIPFIIESKKLHSKLSLDHELSLDENYIFNLSSEYPIRAKIYELSEDDKIPELYFSVVVHHIAFDGWSADIFLGEFIKYYQYYLSGMDQYAPKIDLPALSIQYKDYSLWHHCYLESKEVEPQLSYWREKLKNYETLDLVTDYQRPNSMDFNGDEITFELDEVLSKNLRLSAQSLGVSLYTILFASYCLMLRVYSNQNDIIVGTPALNRHHQQIVDLIGYFVNSVVLRVKIDDEVLIRDFIKMVGQEVIESQINQDVPFSKIVEMHEREKDVSRHPIFQVMFGVQNFGAKKDIMSDILQWYKPSERHENVAQFDLSTFISDANINLRGKFNYSTKLYKRETIEGYIKTYITILEQVGLIGISNEPLAEDFKIASLHYLDEVEYNKIINIWNDTTAEYPREARIHDLFEEQVKYSADKVAVICDDREITYRELNDRANYFARYLRDIIGVNDNDLVTLYLDKNEYVIIAILAILKSGCGYVPIDSNIPLERAEYIIKDTASKVVLTNMKYDGMFEKSIEQVIYVENEKMIHEASQYNNTNIVTNTTSKSIAYVIYTSGTTGKPKGVCGTHRGIINRIVWTNQSLKFDSIEVFTQKTSINFVDHISEIFLPLLNGWKLVCQEQSETLDKFDLIAMLEIMIRNNVTSITVVPSLLKAILEQKIINLEELKNIKYVFCSGEELSLHLVHIFYKLFPTAILVNLYGSSEVSADATCYITNKLLDLVPIGRPINNMKCYVLGANLAPLPINAIGELYISGVGLAEGYLNHPNLNKEKFIENPFFFQQSPTRIDNYNRIYRTGDLVKWLPDGNLEYVGREDLQIKILGHRIELADVESVISSYPSIRECVVIINDISEENKYLSAYYISDNLLMLEDLIEYLRKKLPHYMVPSNFLPIDKVPININGKIDKKALLQKNIPKIKDAPLNNDVEIKVRTIWANILKLSEQNISINDSFFSIGGNSLSAIKLMHDLNNQFTTKYSIKDIFSLNTIKSLAQSIIGKRTVADEVHEQWYFDGK